MDLEEQIKNFAKYLDEKYLKLEKEKNMLEKRIILLHKRNKNFVPDLFSFLFKYKIYEKKAKLNHKINSILLEKYYRLKKIDEEEFNVGLSKTYLYLAY